MKIYKVARKYQRLIRQAGQQTYRDLMEVYDLIMALSYNPYEKLPSEAVVAAKELEKNISALLDKIYLEGADALELKYSVDDLKSKIMKDVINPELSSLQEDLGVILNKLQTLTVADIPRQMPIATLSTDEESTEFGEDFQKTFFQKNKGFEPEKLNQSNTPSQEDLVNIKNLMFPNKSHI